MAESGSVKKLKDYENDERRPQENIVGNLM
jgi:hypothetical protein